MLTKQHRFAMRIASSRLRQEYKTYMCGLCHALGRNYGLPYRLLTSHEMVLLNMLTNAQQLEEPLVVKCRCPLNPLKEVLANQGVACEFASAVAIGLAKVSAEDGVRDSRWWNASSRLLDWTLDAVYPPALENLVDLGFETKLLTQLTELQTSVQEDTPQDAAHPPVLS